MSTGLAEQKAVSDDEKHLLAKGWKYAGTGPAGPLYTDPRSNGGKACGVNEIVLPKDKEGTVKTIRQVMGGLSNWSHRVDRAIEIQRSIEAEARKKGDSQEMMTETLEERPIVERTGYYFREEVGTIAREVGFETREELLAYIASIDAKPERSPC